MILFIVNIMEATAQSKILWPLVLPFFKFDSFTAWHILSIVLKFLFAANEFVAELQIVKLIVTLMCTLRPALINHNHQVNGGFNWNQSRSWTNQHEARKAKQLFLASLVSVRGLPIVEKRSWKQSRYDEKWISLCPNHAISILPIEVHTHNGLPDIPIFKYSNHCC